VIEPVEGSYQDKMDSDEINRGEHKVRP